MPERILPRDFDTPPEFILPLSNVELQELGTFTAIWSQIDWLIMTLIAHITKTDLGQLQVIMENMTTGPRVNLLKKFCAANPDNTNNAIKKLCDDNSGLIDDRNHITHGLWAIEWGEPDWTPRAGCLYQKNNRGPVMATKLKTLSDRAAGFSNQLGHLLAQKNPVFATSRPRKFLFGNEGPGNRKPPPWPPVPPEQPA